LDIFARLHLDFFTSAVYKKRAKKVLKQKSKIATQISGPNYYVTSINPTILHIFTDYGCGLRRWG